MSPTQEAAMKMALEALNSMFNWQVDHERGKLCGDAVVALRDALEEPVQEPVAYIHRQGNYWDTSERHLTDDEKARGWTEEPLYTSPPKQRKPLTEEELKACLPPDAVRVPLGWLNFARAVEAAHGIK